jgi:predicted SAM-dependent methyltransferase
MVAQDVRAPENGAREAVRDYLAWRPRRLAVDRPLHHRIANALLPTARRDAIAVAATRALSPRERRRAASLAAAGPVRLHLGSGWERKDGWTNVDLVGHPVDIAWNLAQGLPFPDDSAEAVFHEHLMEHLPLAAAASLLEESHRVLAPGGVMRVAVPDAGRYLESYARGGAGLIAERRPDRPTSLLAVQEVFYRHHHRSAWDWETLDLFVRAAGFDVCEQRAFGESRIDPCPDSEHRAQESIYVEAVKSA